MMRVWKQVDKCNEVDVANGSVLLGTAAGYKHLENGREDPDDSAVIIEINDLSEHNTNHQLAWNKIEKASGGRVTGMPSSVENLTIKYVAAPVWIYCTSRPGCQHDFTPEKEKVVFEISSSRRWAKYMLKKHEHLLERAAIASVTYRPSRYSFLDYNGQRESYFSKGLKFSPEEEERVIFYPKAGIEVEQIILPPDDEVKKLLRPVPNWNGQKIIRHRYRRDI